MRVFEKLWAGFKLFQSFNFFRFCISFFRVSKQKSYFEYMYDEIGIFKAKIAMMPKINTYFKKNISLIFLNNGGLINFELVHQRYHLSIKSILFFILLKKKLPTILAENFSVQQSLGMQKRN